MKILCVVCEVSEAIVWCCGDEAPLCHGCDQNVHTANKLASRHHRVALMETKSLPKCDICEEAVGYFCREDRALLCSRCDLAVHSLNIHVSAHQRFLFPGVKTGLEPISPVTSSSVKRCAEKQACSKMAPKACPGEHVQPVRSMATNGLASTEACVSEGILERELNDIFGNTGFSKSNVDDKPGDYYYCTPIFSIDEIDFDPDEDLVPSWRVDANLDADDNVVQVWIADHTQLSRNENSSQGDVSSAVDENDSLIRGWTSLGGSGAQITTVGRRIRFGRS